MYVPKKFKESDPIRLNELISSYPFGSLITFDNGRPFASHIPFISDENGLLCHLAKANPQCGHLRQRNEVLCVFQGPHSYVSPSWLESPGVPTWNYAVVHVYGVPSTIEATSALASLVERFPRHFEAGSPDPWKPNYDERLLSAIIGIEIRITEIQGKFKLSQNRPLVDRRNVIARLESAGDALSMGIAELMIKDTP
jgi:transcriptional regulator